MINQPDIRAMSNDFFILKPLPRYIPLTMVTEVKTRNNEIPSFRGISGTLEAWRVLKNRTNTIKFKISFEIMVLSGVFCGYMIFGGHCFIISAHSVLPLQH